VSSATRATPAIPKKVGALPIDGGDAVKQTHEKKATGKRSTDTVYGLTDHTPESADAAAILACNRGHWSIENSCHYLLDWNGDEDRCTIRTGHGPANITALRRFAIGAIKSKSRDTVAATIQRLARNVRRVFDFLGMTEIACRRPRGRPATAG
jgi:predicted transposase YbfD/YdcC